MTEKKKLNRVKVCLAEAGVTNNDLAKGIGVNYTTVSRWCSNDMQPGIETLFEIAKFLDINVRELLPNTK